MRVLTLDGGGVRGLYTLHALKRLEEIYGFKTHEAFDTFGGTSTGGMLALLYASGRSTEELLEIYKIEIPKVFERSWKRKIFTNLGLFEARYSSENLKEIAKKYFGDLTVGQLPKAGYAVAVDITATEAVIIGPQSNFLARDAVVATSAAPTYFRPLIANGRAYCDGALVANNPSTVLMTKVFESDPKLKLSAIRLLSVGTGYFPSGLAPNTVDDMGLLSWAGAITGEMMSIQSRFFDRMTTALLEKNYLRLNCKLSCEIDLASTREQDLAELKALGISSAENVDKKLMLRILNS